MPRSMSMSRNAGLREHLAEEGARLVERLRRERQREDAVIDLRRRVERPAEALEGEVHRVRARDALRPAVDHVLEEMADAVVRRRLEARADARPQRHVRPVQLRQRRDDDAQPVGECGVLELNRRPRAETRRGTLLVFVLVVASVPAVRLRLLDVVFVDLDVVLRLIAQPLDVQAHRLVALGAEELLHERVAVLLEFVARRRLVLS